MLYSYEAINEKGKKETGQLNAENKKMALDSLKAQLLTPIAIIELGTDGKPKDVPFWEKDLFQKEIYDVKVKKKTVFAFLHQMAIMLRSGVSLSLCMEVMKDSEKDKKFKRIITEMHSDLYNGISVAESMQKFKAFPAIVTNIISSGELNGRLDTAFEQAAALLEKEIKLTSQIRGAMIYPCILLVLTIGLVIIMNVVVLPAFTGIFEQFDAELPAITKALMAVSAFMRSFWWLLLLIIVGIIAGYIFLNNKNHAFRLKKDELMLKIPLFGKMLAKSYVSRFCRILASLIDAGVDVVQSLEIARGVIKNAYIQHILGEVAREIKLGIPISESISKYPVFDSLFISMLRVGEESGSLADTLYKMADMYEEQTEDNIKVAMSFLEPAIIVIMAVVVGTVVISIITPMFKMYSIIK